jgi:hypothetical protein
MSFSCGLGSSVPVCCLSARRNKPTQRARRLERPSEQTQRNSFGCEWQGSFRPPIIILLYWILDLGTCCQNLCFGVPVRMWRPASARETLGCSPLVQTGRTDASGVEGVPFVSASQDHRSSLPGDQRQSGQRMRGGSDLRGFFSSVSSPTETMTGLSATGLMLAIMTYAARSDAVHGSISARPTEPRNQREACFESSL